MAGKRILELLRQLSPTGSSGSQIVKSLVWVTSQNALGRVITLAMLVILARLIGPEGLGLVGIALLVLSGVQQFTNIGLNQALIYQKEDNVDSYLDTVWLLEIGRGFLIGAVMFAAAPLIASVFSEPRAGDLVRAIALSPVLVGLKNPAIVYFEKNLDFHKEFAYKMGATSVRFVVSVGYALVEPTAWAFVVGFLAADVAKLVVSYAIVDFRPWFNFDRGAARELVDYGKWITGTSILTFLTTEGDDAFVGWLLGAASLGLYQYAYRLSNAPATEFTQIISRVMFPAFSQVQDETERLRSMFITTLRMTALVSFPASVGIAAVTPSFVRAFLGSEWTGMILAMQILAVYGMLRAIAKTFGPVWKAIGRPDYVTKLSTVRLILIVILIYPLTSAYGIAGTALTVTGVYIFPMMPLDLYVIKHSIGASYRDVIQELTYPFAASAVMFGGVWGLHLTLDVMPILEFGILTVTGVALYVASVAVLELQFGWGIRQNLTSLLSNVKG